MLVWLAFALLAGLVVALVILPLAGGRRTLPGRAAYDRAVYRDQLAEIERDRDRGLLSATEAASARLEIERRLLGTATERESSAPRKPAPVSRLLVLALALAVPLGAAGIYLLRGSPQLPDLPYAARDGERRAAQVEGNRDLAQVVSALEARLKQTPDDGDGWLLLARTQQTLEHWQESGEAYRHALALMGDRADIEASYGEMLFLAASGIVTPAARDAFAAALAHDSGNPAARYYLALADAQAGNAQAAIDAWQKLLADSPAGAGWIPTVRQRIEETAKAAGLPVPAPPAAAGPSADDLAAAANLSPEERAKMVRGMVDRLAARLETQPNDLQGWLRLARAYEVLQEQQKAGAAYDRAAALAPGDPSILAREVDALMAGRAATDPVPDGAIAVLKRLEALKPEEPRVLWYLGLAAAQAHRPEEAKARWQKLLALLPPDSDEHKMVAAALTAISGGN